MSGNPHSSLQMIAMGQIRLDGGTQPRAALNEAYLTELLEVVAEGGTLPPVMLYHDGSAYWLADGFHRSCAMQRSGHATIAAQVCSGTRRDALLYAVGANAQHGLRRTNADKRRAVEILLTDPEWSRWSDREIARRCSVSHDFVRRSRMAICHSMPDTARFVQRNGAVYTLDTTHIGHTQEPDPLVSAVLCSPFPPSQEMRSPLPKPCSSPAVKPESAETMEPLLTTCEVHARSAAQAPSQRDDREATIIEALACSREERRFLAESVETLHRQVLTQEKARRNTHVLRVMGSSESPEWYTPQEIIQLVSTLLGTIDLDPCSNSLEAPAVPARVLYTKAEDGLRQSWRGRTYLNPPYGNEIALWVQKLIQSYEAGEVPEALALLPGRIDTTWFQPLYAYPLCLIRGRLQFANSPHHAPFPCVIVYLGQRQDAFVAVFKGLGPILRRIG